MGANLKSADRAVDYTSGKLETYLSHRTALVDYVARITGCRARAEDLVQDVFFRFVPGNEGSPASSGVGYLYRIARNLAIDFVRRSAMENRHQNERMVEWLRPQEIPGPEQMVQQRANLERIADILDDLPEKERIAVEMHRVGGYTFAEIADRLGISVPTAHRMVRNAVIKVAAAME